LGRQREGHLVQVHKQQIPTFRGPEAYRVA